MILSRFGYSEAGCNPIATSLIADYFSIELRGAALGIYNWGIYSGYSASFAIGNQILKHLVGSFFTIFRILDFEDFMFMKKIIFSARIGPGCT